MAVVRDSWLTCRTCGAGNMMMQQENAGHTGNLAPIAEEAMNMNMQRPPHDSDDEDWDDIER